MTSRIDALKTNEFLRRRKLRLQQVREQSKEIAKKIRQRAKVETVRHLQDIDAKKEKEYFDCQEKLVKHLEYLHSQRLQNIGVSHKNALETNCIEVNQDLAQKVDVSKLRGIQAVAELRRKKQEKLDEQKKLLDRKLLAREAANEISREKSATVTKSSTKQTTKQDTQNKPVTTTSELINKTDNNQNQDIINNPDATKNDMGTQWESDELPNEWEPNIPTLSLPKDDSVKDSLNVEKIDKSKKLNLFALSDEMPSSLRGGLSGNNDDAVPTKTSLTLVSEYLQNRNLKLRQIEPISRKKADDLQSIKQTILRTRATRADGNKDKSSQCTELNTCVNRKKSISVYNHNTRNTQDIQCGNEKLVHRDDKSEEDAYSQAFKETTIASSLEKDHLSKLQMDMRTKVAVTKNNVDKEYKDTLAFLNSLAKDKSDKPIETAYMDDYQQQSQNERHQKKLQQEFKRIEKECYKHNNCKKSKRNATIFEKRRSETKSPIRKDFEYSWMPVPESDGNLAIHTIPNTRNKSANTVKFSETDSYHEYRSRHKHTPPTKDVSNERQKKRIVETVILQQTGNDSDINESSVTSEISSTANFNLETDKTEEDSKLKDAERIIIYKILESKQEKKSKDHQKMRPKKTGNYNNEPKTQFQETVEGKQQQIKKLKKSAGHVERGISFDQLQEGIYEAVSNNGDNIASMYFSEDLQRNHDKTQKINKVGTDCCCNKTEGVQNNGENISQRLFKQASCKCKCRNKESSPLTHPSTATSSTSFTTANNDKTNNRIPGGGIIRLLEEDGQKNSKFYIGASGFLKDANYEVVIQLRKKEAERVNTIINTKESIPQNNTVKSLDLEIEKNERNHPDNVVSNSQANEIPTSAIKVSTNGEEIIAIHERQSHGQTEIKESEVMIFTPEPKLEHHLNDMCEKSVHTSFQDTFAIPANVPKSDPISRPATSACTQTSFNSPTPKPAFIHMSSSTSTAYMSPPELILPKFLNRNYVFNDEQVYESENTINQLDCNFKVLEGKTCKQPIHCTCKFGEINQLKTPPNTARSCSKETPTVGYVKTHKVICKCHKRRSSSETNICHKSHRKKSHSTLRTRSSRDLPSNYSNPNFKKSTKNNANPCSRRKINSIKLNPTVKSYVNRLLDLNSEGLKAIEIINQNCSAATTPSSSIINLPCNRKKYKSTIENKISLEQIKNILKQQIFDNMILKENANKATLKSKESQTEKVLKTSMKIPKKKAVHKVKSLNISKHILKKNKPSDSFIKYPQRLKKPAASVPSSVREESKLLRVNKQDRSGGKTSSTPITYDNSEYKNSTSSDIAETTNNTPCRLISSKNLKVYRNKPSKNTMCMNSQRNKNLNLSSHRAVRTSFSSDSDANAAFLTHLPPPQPPLHISTQTNSVTDPEINFMKVAEDKLQNMEKIADLTEKCTKRLSNLAKVLEEVRKNKSLIYSQISTSDSTPDSELKTHKNEISSENSVHLSEPNILTRCKETMQNLTSSSVPDKLDDKYIYGKDCTDFMPFLKDIPKPETFTTPQSSSCCNSNDVPSKSTEAFIESENIKSRGRPPPALSRIHLKRGQDVNIIPHELSTVIEVDSPMSMKVKNQTSRVDTKIEMLDESDDILDKIEKRSTIVDDTTTSKENQVDPDILQSNINLSRQMSKSSSDSSDNSKVRMMDMNKFNDIMLKPFISLKEYAHQCNVGLDEGSNSDSVIKGEAINDDLSSLHSEGSLPDVIAELLKRNIISEPFKFDSGSNVNSTTLSSESTLSILALSKARKEKKKSSMLLKNKDHITETSGTLSLSSNPDLENAFQKLGMGWASSTLKKTKERLALSSSSTSSSSMTQFKIKSINQDLPNIALDSTSSMLDVSKKRDKKRSSSGRYNIEEISKNVVQQTSLTNSMTVKEFLTNELAKKITFNNKSSRKEPEGEFLSLYETKMPEEMKLTHIRHEEDQLSVASVNHNRARTSTPVQIFKSQTYHSSSTSNTSNGFFSNADDLSSVKVTSTSIRNHSTSDKDDLTIPNYSLKTKQGLSDCSKSD